MSVELMFVSGAIKTCASAAWMEMAATRQGRVRILMTSKDVRVGRIGGG
jgi:hypothetical protein